MEILEAGFVACLVKHTTFPQVVPSESGMEAQVINNKQFSATFMSDNIQNTWTSHFLLPSYRLPMKKKQAHMLTLRSAVYKKQERRTFGPFQQLKASSLVNGEQYESFENNLLLQNKIQEILPYIGGRCVYLVGMMGSGKTTVGRILSEVLGYSFCDSDKLVEQAVGASVSEIFKLYGEGHFRDKESKELENLSTMKRLVVSTGGGAVVRPVNWTHMQTGITVWIDVPLEALAQRIAAVGTDSRPLLHYESGDAYTKALLRLDAIWKERGRAYANAHTRVSLEDIAAKHGHTDVFNLSPAAIAFEVLEKIEEYVKIKPSHQ